MGIKWVYNQQWSGWWMLSFGALNIMEHPKKHLQTGDFPSPGQIVGGQGIFLTLSSHFHPLSTYGHHWPPNATHISTNIKQPGPDNLAWHSVNRLPGVVYRFLHLPCGIWPVMCGTRIDGSSYPTCPFNTFQLKDWNDVDNWITVGEPKSEILIRVAYVLFGTVSFPLKASTFCRDDPLSSRSRVSWSSWVASVAMIRSFCWGKWVSDPWQGIPLSDPWYTWGKTIG